MTDVFNDELAGLLKEYLEVEEAIERCRAHKKQCDEEISMASKYIGEIKGQMIELMDEYGVVSSESGSFLISKKRVKPSIVIKDNAQIPDRFCRIKKEPDKLALANALKSGQELEGVQFNNGSETIQIRSK